MPYPGAVFPQPPGRLAGTGRGHAALRVRFGGALDPGGQPLRPDPADLSGEWLAGDRYVAAAELPRQHLRDPPLPAPLQLRSRRPAHLRSEEHTSELQSPTNLVCRLLLEKKK